MWYNSGTIAFRLDVAPNFRVRQNYDEYPGLRNRMSLQEWTNKKSKCIILVISSVGKKWLRQTVLIVRNRQTDRTVLFELCQSGSVKPDSHYFNRYCFLIAVHRPTFLLKKKMHSLSQELTITDSHNLTGLRSVCYFDSISSNMEEYLTFQRPSNLTRNILSSHQ